MSGSIDRRTLIASALLGGGALAGFALAPGRARARISQSALDAAIPDRVGQYRGGPADDVVLAPRDELSTRIYDRYVARAYTAPGWPRILLVAAYGATQDYQLQLHRPESCYPASGWTLGDSRRVLLPLADGRRIPAITMPASAPGRSEQLLYWTRIGDSFPGDAWTARAVILRRALRRDPPDGTILRLSMPSHVGDRAVARLAAFNRALIAGMSAPARDLLLGQAS